jgi:hypothetical protein
MTQVSPSEVSGVATPDPVTWARTVDDTGETTEISMRTFLFLRLCFPEGSQGLHDSPLSHTPDSYESEAR